MWGLAWRNLGRNRTRTLITGSAIALTLALRLISVGTADAMYAKMMEGAVRTAGGAILIHEEGYWRARTSDRVVDHPDAVLAAVRDVPGVKAAIPRVLITGLVTSPRGNAGALITGISPRDEAALQDLGKYIAEGQFLDGDLERPIVLGRKMVEDLGLEIGKRVKVTVTDPEGEVRRALFRLSGILDTGSEMMDAGAAYTTLEAAREAIGLGERITQVGVLVEGGADRHQVRDAIAQRLGQRHRGLEILTWDEAMPALLGFIDVDRSMGEAMNWVLLIVVVFGIVNTFLMAMLERVREYGLLGALGLTPGRLARLVIAEGTLLGAVSVGIGLILALAAHSYLAGEGIDIAAISNTDIEISGVVLDDMKIKSHLEPITWVAESVLVMFLVVASALYPARRATRVHPAVAMRTYE